MIEIFKEELHVLELDGFLNALRCIMGHADRCFGAGLIKKDSCIDTIIDGHIQNISINGKFLDKKKVNFEYIQKIFDKFIYSKLPISDKETLRNTDWNLVEYYGLISTVEDKGEWNRLVNQDHVLLEYEDEHGRKSIHYYVEYNEFVITTFLTMKK